MAEDAEIAHSGRSLAFALQAIARAHGYSIDLDDLSAALGLSMMVCSPKTEEDLSRWPCYARDAFLIPAARLFGMEVREIHPPDAAVGLAGLREFRQHFDASYRPLIANALSHGQAVLAWRGWPGDQEPMWGIIRGQARSNVGFWGTIVGSSRNMVFMPRFALVQPPVQVYIVEKTFAAKPDPDELAAIALKNARCLIENGIGRRFEVITGPAAYDEWIKRLEKGATGSSALAGELIRGHRSASRFCQRLLTSAATEWVSGLRSLKELCDRVTTSLIQFRELLTRNSSQRNAVDLGGLMAPLSVAKNATLAARNSLPGPR